MVTKTQEKYNRLSEQTSNRTAADIGLLRGMIVLGLEEQELELRKNFIFRIRALQDLCFKREAQLSKKIKGHDYHNGYSCALHDIRKELDALKKQDVICVTDEGGQND